MNLEEEVVKEVNSWEISLIRVDKEEVNYSDFVKPIIYGIGIGIVKKLRDLLIEKSNFPKIKSYLEFDFETAVKTYKRDYLLHHLIRCDFSSRRTAEEIFQPKSPEESRQRISKILAEIGLNLKEIRDNPYKYMHNNVSINGPIKEEELIKFVENEIKRYADCITLKMFKDAITTSSRELAKRFVRIGKQSLEDIRLYLGLNFNTAQELFKLNYLEKQYHKNHMNIEKAAEASGMTLKKFKANLANLGATF